MVDEFYEVLKKRREQCNPMWLKYEVSLFNSKAFLAAITGKTVDQDESHTAKMQFALKENKCLAERIDFLDKGPQTIRQSYNGEVTVKKGLVQDLYSISRKPFSATPFEDPRELGSEGRFLEMLENLKSSKVKPKEIMVSKANPKAPRELTFVYANSEVAKVWVKPEEDFLVPRLEFYDAEGKVKMKSTTSDWQYINGIPFPKKGTSAYFYQGDMTKKADFVVNLIEIRRSAIPDNIFDPNIPKDSPIFDEDLKVLVRDPQEAQKHLERVVALIRKGQPPWWRKWIIPLLTALVLLFLGVALYKHRWKKKKIRDKFP